MPIQACKRRRLVRDGGCFKTLQKHCLVQVKRAFMHKSENAKASQVRNCRKINAFGTSTKVTKIAFHLHQAMCLLRFDTGHNLRRTASFTGLNCQKCTTVSKSVFENRVLAPKRCENAGLAQLLERGSAPAIQPAAPPAAEAADFWKSMAAM